MRIHGHALGAQIRTVVMKFRAPISDATQKNCDAGDPKVGTQLLTGPALAGHWSGA